MVQRFLKNNLFILYVIMWMAVSAIHFFLLAGAWGIESTQAALDSLVFNSLFAIIGTGLWFWTRYSDIRKRTWLELIFNHITGSTVSILLWLLAGFGLMRYFVPENQYYNDFLDSSLMVRAISGLFYYLLLVSVFYLLTVYRELFEKTKREGELTTLLRDAELNMLRSQIRPHFLFNSLNSISSLIISKPEKAQEMVIKLSEFMRYSLSHQDESFITLEQELYHMGLYLEIEKVRFSDRLIVEYDICNQCLHRELPAMILQPLLENAVKYGIYENIGPTGIRIEAGIQDVYLNIRVSNSFDPDSPVRKGTGTGLKNISKRLQTVYNRYDLITISKEKNEFCVELKIPGQ